MSFHNLQNTNTNFDPTVTHEDFLNQLLSWSDIPPPDHFDDHSTFLSSKLHQQQITGEPALFLNDHSSFKSPVGDNGSTQNLFHGFTRPLASNQPQHYHNLSPQSFGSPGPVAAFGGGGGGSSQPRQRVRARRGQATDPHSIAERLRRERITERMKALQELVPNTNKADKASMLDDIIEYVRFLQLQVKVLSTSRLGGDTVGVEHGIGRNSKGRALSSHNDTMTVTEKQVVKLMEQDMGSAMQYLQGKGLCLMPISLASTISSDAGNNYSLGGEDVGGPSSPNMSVMTLQSANGVPMKDSP